MRAGRPPDALTSAHRRMLEVDRAISANVLAEEDVRSLENSDQLPKPDSMLTHYALDKAARFGQWPTNLGSGIWIPARDTRGRLNGQYRPDDPRRFTKPESGKEHVLKYESCPGTRSSIGVPERTRPYLQDRARPLLWVEGHLKALSAVSEGWAAVSLSGVENWKVRIDDETSLEIPDLDDIELLGRVCAIAFDSDAATNRNVRDARRRLRRTLEKRGATVLTLEIPPAADGSKQGIDDYRAAGGSIWTLFTDAIRQLEITGGAAVPVGGSDGAQTCTACPELREQIKEYKATEQLERDGPFSPVEARIILEMERLAGVTLTNGQEKIALLREDLAKDSLHNPKNVKAVSRAWKVYEGYQDDPDLAGTLPFRLARRTDEHGKEHVDLYPVRPEEPWTRTDRLLALARLPRDLEARPRPGGNQRRPGACPRCESPMKQTATRVCTNEACGCTYSLPSRIVGDDPSESRDAGRNVPRQTAAIHGADFTLAAHPNHEDEGQNVPSRLTTQAGHSVPRPTQAAAFDSRDDQEAAAGPHLRLLPDLDEQEPPEPCIRPRCSQPCGPGDPLLCVEHRAEANMPLAVSGGSE